MTFDDLVWDRDRMTMGDWVFRLQHLNSDDWELGDNCFSFYKIKPLVDQYAQYFSLKPEFLPKNILELGMWDGGSTAFWFELFKPDRHVGIDIEDRVDSKYFRSYISSQGLAERIKTYWKTDQTDSEKLRSIVEKEFYGGIDLVIDDASHLYNPTKRSFETLFPFVKHGGLYIIEDWAWSHWPEFQDKDHFWFNETPLTNFIVEILEATGSWVSDSGSKLVESVSVYQGFVVIEKGGLDLPLSGEFKLEQFIRSKPRIPISTTLLRKVKGILDKYVMWRFR